MQFGWLTHCWKAFSPRRKASAREALPVQLGPLRFEAAVVTSNLMPNDFRRLQLQWRSLRQGASRRRRELDFGSWPGGPPWAACSFPKVKPVKPVKPLVSRLRSWNVKEFELEMLEYGRLMLPVAKWWDLDGFAG